jgi:alpha-beta hydrolase superfamily lysophospholipase
MLKLVLGLTLGLVAALAIVGSRNRHRFRYRPAPLGEAEYRQLADTQGFRADEAEVEPEVRLRGLIRPPATPSGHWLFYFPGNGSGVLGGARELLLRLAPSPDLGVAVWAYRGFDGSGGTPSMAKLAADSERLCQRLCSEFGAAPQRLHLVSFSLGTALALRLASVLEARGTPPASLVLLSPYDRLQVTRDVWWAPWMFADEYDALLYAGGSKVDALLLHGTMDDAVPLVAARELARAMGPRATLIELDGRGHADWLGDDTVLATVREFLAGNSK